MGMIYDNIRNNPSNFNKGNVLFHGWSRPIFTKLLNTNKIKYLKHATSIQIDYVSNWLWHKACLGNYTIGIQTMHKIR